MVVAIALQLVASVSFVPAPVSLRACRQKSGLHVATTDALVAAIASGESCLVLTSPEYNLTTQLSIEHSVRMMARDAHRGSSLSTSISSHDAGGATLRGVPWQSHRVLSICESCVVELAGLRVVGGDGRRGDGPSSSTLFFGCGGGVVNHGSLTLDRTIVAHNVAANAGGLCNWQGASLTLIRSTICHNTAAVSDCPASCICPHTHFSHRLHPFAAQNGGGLANIQGTLTLDGSTVTENIAEGDEWAFGGGLSIHGGSATLISSVIAHNTARGSGGVFNGGNLTMANSTLRDNTPDNLVETGSANHVVLATMRPPPPPREATRSHPRGYVRRWRRILRKHRELQLGGHGDRSREAQLDEWMASNGWQHRRGSRVGTGF